MQRAVRPACMSIIIVIVPITRDDRPRSLLGPAIGLTVEVVVGMVAVWGHRVDIEMAIWVVVSSLMALVIISGIAMICLKKKFGSSEPWYF